MTELVVRGLSKRFPNGVRAVAELDLSIAAGALCAIVGPSGSGKSTLLRLIAGLDAPDEGSVWIGGERVDALAPHRRGVGMVFQHPALYPYLSVFENLAFGLRARRPSRLERAGRVREGADRLNLGALLERRPATLSGGERQRVALGRVLNTRPRVLLLDEPLAGLDAPLRAEIRARLIDLHRASGMTTVLVTHDQAEALALGDRIAVLDRGRIVQSGTAEALYDHPNCRFVARFLGSPPMNLLPCALSRSDDGVRIDFLGYPPESAWSIPDSAPWVAPIRDRLPGEFDLGVRPEDWTVDDPSAPSPWALTGHVIRVEPLGHETIVTLAAGVEDLSLRLPPGRRPRVGDLMTVACNPARARWFEARSGRAIGIEEPST